MNSPWNMNQIVGENDIIMIVFDTLRYDVAVDQFTAGSTPNIQTLSPAGWQKRHSPGSFTYAAHHAFFAGFLPTPADPQQPGERLFATQFAGSETTGSNTQVFEQATIIEGLKTAGYYTLCVGGVGFFNQQTALSRVFPDMFDQSYWDDSTGVTDPRSTENQIAIARQLLATIPSDQSLFFYLNIAAIHQPNCHYLKGQTVDDLNSHAAALRYVDSCLPELFDALASRCSSNHDEIFLIACSDHGTLYGEEGFIGHRVGHEAVFTVPYFDGLIQPRIFETKHGKQAS